MSSFDNLFKRVQMLEEAKYPEYNKLKKDLGIGGKMKKAGLPASSRDTMLFITRALSRTNIITSEEHDHTVKGQHTDRMEKIMAILRNKEEEINAKSDELVEYINKNLDNYTAGAGTDRGRVEKYKETAKYISQEVQNIKAGKETDDALRDIVKKADEDLLDSLGFAGEDDTTIVEIDAGNVANVERIRAKVEELANELGVEVTGNRVEFSVNAGSVIDTMVQQRGVAGTEAFLRDAFKGDYPVFVSIIPPASPDEKAKIEGDIASLSKKKKAIAEPAGDVLKASRLFLQGRGLEGAEDAERQVHSFHTETDSCEACSDPDCQGCDTEDGEGKRCDYVPCTDEVEDAEVTQLDPGVMETIDVMIGAAMEMEDTEYPEVKGMVEAGIGRELTDEERAYLMDELGVEPGDFEDAEYQSPYDDTEAKLKDAADMEGIYCNLDGEGGLVDPREVHDLLKGTEGGSPVTDDDIDRLLGGGKSPITESISLENVYGNMGFNPTPNTIDENGTIASSCNTKEYLIESAESHSETVGLYTGGYLTEQKTKDSYIKSKPQKGQTFQERYKPKTSGQLEELRRYGL